MKTLFRLAFRLLLLLIVLIVASVLLLDPVAREIAEYQIGHGTGLEVRIGKLDIGLLNPEVTVENLVIYNNADFGGGPLLDMPEFHVEYDRRALFSRRIHCRLVRVKMTSGSIVEDKAGRLNIEALGRRVQKESAGTLTASTNRPSTTGFQFAGVDTLNLTMDKVDLVSLKDPSRTKTLTIDLHNSILTNITSARGLAEIYPWIALHNGLDLSTKGSGDPNDPWQYWRGKLDALEK